MSWVLFYPECGLIRPTDKFKEESRNLEITLQIRTKAIREIRDNLGRNLEILQSEPQVQEQSAGEFLVLFYWNVCSLPLQTNTKRETGTSSSRSRNSGPSYPTHRLQPNDSSVTTKGSRPSWPPLAKTPTEPKLRTRGSRPPSTSSRPSTKHIPSVAPQWVVRPNFPLYGQFLTFYLQFHPRTRQSRFKNRQS